MSIQIVPLPHDKPLLAYIPLLSPEMAAPVHLEGFVSCLERAPHYAAQHFEPVEVLSSTYDPDTGVERHNPIVIRCGEARILCSVPIRHWKTETVKHAIAWWLRRWPKLRILFITYGAIYAQTRGREIRDLCAVAGVSIKKGHSTIHEWRTEEGGGVYVMSADQSALGQDVDIIVVDDPIESFVDADNPAHRQIVDATIAFYTNRLSPGGSCCLLASRFHQDDPIGRRLRRTAVQWAYIHHRAIWTDDCGEELAFAPHIRSLDLLRKIRAEECERDPSERIWWSQWQGEPRSDSGDLFREPAFYERIPDDEIWREGIGLDMAFSKARTADFFADVHGRVIGGSHLYVQGCQRYRADYGEAMAQLRARKLIVPNGALYSYMSGPEIGAAHYFGTQGLQITIMHARFDKRTRAQRTIDRWNAGAIALPYRQPWTKDVIARAKSFRGIEGDEDDEIDALVSLCDGAMFFGGSGPPTKTFGRPRI